MDAHKKVYSIAIPKYQYRQKSTIGRMRTMLSRNCQETDFSVVSVSLLVITVLKDKAGKLYNHKTGQGIRFKHKKDDSIRYTVCSAF